MTEATPGSEEDLIAREQPYPARHDVTSAAPEPTDEQLRMDMWHAIVDVRDAAPRRFDDADSEHIVDALEPIVARALAAAVAAEREKVAAEYRSRIQQLIDDEEQAQASDPGWDITVWVPERAGAEFHEKMFDAIADLAYEVQPEERDWDIGCMSVKGHPQVTVKQLGWALDTAARRIREVSR